MIREGIRAAGWSLVHARETEALTTDIFHRRLQFSASFNAAWAATRRATGTRNGEQLT